MNTPQLDLFEDGARAAATMERFALTDDHRHTTAFKGRLVRETADWEPVDEDAGQFVALDAYAYTTSRVYETVEGDTVLSVTRACPVSGRTTHEVSRVPA